MKHLLVDITAHGFGHIAQAAAVLNALECAAVHLTIRSTAPESVLRGRINRPFTLIPYQQDNGMVMHDALRVDVPASMRWYEEFHAGYAERKQQAVRELEALQPDLLFANVPYLSLEAAAAVGVPAVALCSLNWADVFHAYCAHLPGARWIFEEMLNAYVQAEVFLQPAPSMDMHPAITTRPIAPVAQLGRRQPQRLREQARVPDTARFILVALGGLGMIYPLENWPYLDSVYWVFPDSVANGAARPDFLPVSAFGLDYVDLLASCDVVMTKTGYGTQTEAVVNQVPALCIKRLQWPEEPNLPRWHQAHGEVEFVSWQEVQAGDFAGSVMTLLEAAWRKPAVYPNGAAEAAGILRQRLEIPQIADEVCGSGVRVKFNEKQNK